VDVAVLLSVEGFAELIFLLRGSSGSRVVSSIDSTSRSVTLL
jgi:predicted alpha/beta hydrolase